MCIRDSWWTAPADQISRISVFPALCLGRLLSFVFDFVIIITNFFRDFQYKNDISWCQLYMSYLLPCRPRCLFFTVHRSFPPAFHFQIIPVVKPRQFIFILPLRKICQISPHTITFNFTFHEKTLPTTFSASARSFRKSSSPLRRLFTLHPNTCLLYTSRCV